jgi:ketosteroid isomerase-like protein
LVALNSLEVAMQNSRRILVGITLLSTVAAACAKKDADQKEDSGKAMATAAPAHTFDKSAEVAAIRKQDELWTRSLTSKNLDSLMTTYTPDAISMGDGRPAAKGTDAVRTAYAAFLKANPRDLKVTSNDASFSDDGTVAYEHGSFAGTIDGPGGKPMKMAGDYVAVWKKDAGVWKTVEENLNSTLRPGI